jgi:protein involved in ribonucleotide reduction
MEFTVLLKGEEYRMTPLLRFIERDGKRILQQGYLKSGNEYVFAKPYTLTADTFRWEDVPFVVDEE